jgi:hypothetical protein
MRWRLAAAFIGEVTQIGSFWSLIGCAGMPRLEPAAQGQARRSR